MIPIKTSSLTWRLTRVVVVVAILCGVILNLLQIALDFRSEEKRVEKIIEQIIQSSLPTAVEVAFKLDEAGAAELVDGLLYYDFIQKVAIYDDRGEILAEGGVSEQVKSDTLWLTEMIFSQYAEKSRKLIREDETYAYGRLYLKINNDKVYSDLYSRSVNVFLSGLARNMFLTLVLLAIFYFLLTRPLLCIASFFSSIQPESNRGKRLPEISGHSNDEVGEIIKRANYFLESNENFFFKTIDAQRELTKQSQYLRNILNTTAEGFFSTDSHEIIQDTNPSMEKLLGLMSRDIIGRSLYDFVDPTNSKILDEELKKSRKGEQSRYTVSLVHNSGRLFPCSFSASPLFDDEGRYAGSFAFITDISEAVASEKKRKQLEAELLQARKMESIGTLAGGIAHDFNNILAAVIGYSEMAIDDAEDISDVKNDLDQVLHSANRGKELVKQILAFSRLSTKNSAHVDLFRIVEETVDILRPSLSLDTEILLRTDPSVRTVYADPAQLQQVVMNLCTNACQAMEGSGGVLTIELKGMSLRQKIEQRDDHGKAERFLRLMVQDTGEGIEENIRERVFDPFFTTKEVGKGTGMGLSIVHGIVKECGGWLEIDSRLGMGTTVYAYFPETDNVEKGKDNSTVKSAGGETILFIDDQKPIRETARKNLSNFGYEVVVCTTPFEAISVFRQDPYRFDLIVTDYSMPGLTGLELMDRLFAIREHIPAILLTGYSTAVSGSLLRQAGIRGFAFKPLSKDEMANLVRQVLDGRTVLPDD